MREQKFRDICAKFHNALVGAGRAGMMDMDAIVDADNEFIALDEVSAPGVVAPAAPRELDADKLDAWVENYGLERGDLVDLAYRLGAERTHQDAAQQRDAEYVKRIQAERQEFIEREKRTQAEARSAQLAAYVQHKTECGKRCVICGGAVNGVRHVMPDSGDPQHRFKAEECSCGLSALLAAADPSPHEQEQP